MRHFTQGTWNWKRGAKGSARVSDGPAEGWQSTPGPGPGRAEKGPSQAAKGLSICQG